MSVDFETFAYLVFIWSIGFYCLNFLFIIVEKVIKKYIQQQNIASLDPMWKSSDILVLICQMLCLLSGKHLSSSYLSLNALYFYENALNSTAKYRVSQKKCPLVIRYHISLSRNIFVGHLVWHKIKYFLSSSICDLFFKKTLSKLSTINCWFWMHLPQNKLHFNSK